MKREHNWPGDNGEYTLTTEASATVIPLMGMSGLSVEVDGAKTIEVYGSNQKDADEDTTFRVAYDYQQNPIKITCTGPGVWEAPPSIMSFAKVKLVLSGGGTIYVFTKA